MFYSTLFTFTVAAVLLFITGCKTGPTYKPGFDFSRYHTFAILPMATAGTYQDPSIVTRLGGPARESALATLRAKGFKDVPEAEADFHVKMLFDWLPEKGTTEQRMFRIEMLDGKSREVVWATGLHRTTDTAWPPEVVRERVAEMLKPFPPKP